MGKLLMTNRKEWNDELRECYSKNGFSSNGTIDEGVFLTTYNKLNVKTYNLHMINDDFIACAGTLIYKEKIGEKALADLYTDWCEKDLKYVRKNAVGNFVVAVKRNNEIKIFVDETGTYPFYYYNDDNNNYLLTNTYYHIEKCVKEEIKVNSFIENIIGYCNLNNETPFKNIFRLRGDECVCLNVPASKMWIEKCELNEYKLETDDLDEIVDILAATLTKYAKQLKIINKVPALFATGGVDSRLILGVYLSSGIKPRLANWQGSPVIMNTKADDAKLVGEIARILGLEYYEYDVQTDFAQDVNNMKLEDFDKYGEYSLEYGNNKKWQEIFENSGMELLDFGVMAEMFKSLEMLDKANQKEFTLDKFVDLYIGRTGFFNQSQRMKNYEQYREHIYSEFLEMAVSDNMDIQHLSNEDCLKLYNYYYGMHANTTKINFANMFGYGLLFGTQKELCDYINQIPYYIKQKKKLSLLLTKKLYLQLLEIPYYSHCRYMKYDAKENKLEAIKSDSYKTNLEELLKPTKFGKVLIVLKRKIIGKKNKRILEFCCNSIQNSSTYKKLGVEIDEQTFGYFPIYALWVCRLKMADLLLK